MGQMLMRTNRATLIIALIIQVFVYVNSHAAPENISVSGTLTNGQTVIITGSGFGTKSQAAPELWDTFENAANGSSLAGRSPIIGETAWGAIGDPTVTGNNQRGDSSHSFYAIYDGVNDYNNSIYFSKTETGTGAKKYFSFWWRAGRAGSTWSINMKPWQHYGSGTGTNDDNPMYYIGAGSPTNNDGSFRSNVIDLSSGLPRSGSTYGCGSMVEIEHQWVRWEGYVVLSDPGVQNGRMEVWKSQPSIYTRANCIHHATAVTRATTAGFDQWAFGEFVGTSGGTVSSTVYMDDVYIDNTLARVELCDAQTLAASTHCEVQPLTSWSDTAATLTFNPGSFAPSSTAYMYVIDANGDANATGYAVTIGESSTPTPINGACGSNSGATLSSLTSGDTNNCSAGTVSGFTGSGPWTWTCEGINGSDVDDPCSASLTSGSISAWLTSGGSVLTSGGSILTPAQ